MSKIRKIIAAVAATAATVFSALSLSGCGMLGPGSNGHKHSYGSFTYNNDATCGEDGTETATCSCGHTITQTKSHTATGDHSFGAYTYNNDATCGEDGTETATCGNCGKTDTRTKEGSSAIGAHDYEDYICKLCYTLDPDAPYTEELTYSQIIGDGFALLGYSVSKGNAFDSKYLKIPATYSGKPVLSIQDEAFSRCNIRNVVIPDSVKVIGDKAFYNCGISHVEIPDGVTSIGEEAFASCGVMTASIPNSVTYIGSRAFFDNFFMQYTEEDGAQYWGNSENPYLVLFDVPSTITQFTMKPETQIIYSEAFDNCNKLTNIEISENVTCIGSMAFISCSSLTKVQLPAKLKTIGAAAFSFCSKLRDINIPDGVTSIGKEAFAYCNNIISMTIPKSVTEIGKDLFYQCTGRIIYCEATEAPSGWDSSWAYGGIVFNCTENDKDSSGYAYTTVNGLAYSIKDGEAGVYLQPSVISSNITIPSSVQYKGNYYPVKRVEYGAFRSHKNLNYITLPNTITEIGASAFIFCSALRSITLPSNLTRIGNGAFSGCEGLTTVAIPSKVKTIEQSAFSGCTGLTKVTIPLGITTMDMYVFNNCPKLTIYCAESSKPSGWFSSWNGSCEVVWGHSGT